MSEKKTKKKAGKIAVIVLLVILSLLLVAAIVAGIYLLPLYRAYKNSFDTTPIVERPDYTVPDTPDLPVITVDQKDWTEGPEDPNETDFPFWTDPYDSTTAEPEDPSTPADATTSSPEPVTEPETGTSVPVTDVTTKPIDTTKPADTTKPTDTTKPADTTKPTDTTKPADTTKPVDTSRPASTTKPADTTTPKPTEPVTTAEPHEVPSTGIYKVARMDPNIENILLIGIDTRDAASFSGRSDSMMILSYNKKTGEVKIISLLRDMLVPIQGHGWDKLNSAYAYGGAALCINTINDYFGLDIQKYVAINFNGVITLIDKCGGVDLKLSQAEYDYLEDKNVQSLGDGTYHLTGAQAKKHMSNRYVGTDFERANRQRTVLIALYQQLTAKKSVNEILDIITFGFAYVRTNIPLSYITNTAANMLSWGNKLKITSDKIPCDGSWSFGYYGSKAIININRSKNIAYLKKIIWNK